MARTTTNKLRNVRCSNVIVQNAKMTEYSFHIGGLLITENSDQVK